MSDERVYLGVIDRNGATVCEGCRLTDGERVATIERITQDRFATYVEMRLLEERGRSGRRICITDEELRRDDCRWRKLEEQNIEDR